MFNWLKNLYRSRWYISLIILFLMLMVYLFFEIRNNRFWLSDFQVYHQAAGRIVQGQNIYQGEIDGFYRYKYSPTAALFFIPIGMLPLTPAKVLYWVFLSSVICIGFYLSLRLVRPWFRMLSPAYINNMILLAALILGVNIERELHLGQVNQLLLVSYLLIILLIRDNKTTAPALIWAAGIFLKPFGIILLPYFLAIRKFRPVIYFLVFLSIFAIAPVIFTGIDNLGGQYSSWFSELAIELSQKQDLLQNGNHTMFSVLARYTPVRFLAMAPMSAMVFQSVILILISVVVIFLIRQGWDLQDSMILESFFLIGLIPLLSFTSYNAFGFLEPALILVLFNMPGLSNGQRILAIAGVILIGINMHDLVGHKLWVLFNDLSLVAIGAVILLSVLTSMRARGLA